MKRAQKFLLTFCREVRFTAAQERKTFVAIKSLWLCLGFEPRVHDLSLDKLETLAASMQAKGNSGQTINATLQLLARLARLAAAAGLIEPLGERPKVPNTPPAPKEPDRLAFNPPEVSAPVVIPRPRPLPKEKPRTCADLFERWYLPRVLVQASEHYVYRFRHVLGMFSLFLGRTATPADLTDENILDYMAWIVGKGRTAATGNTHRKQLVALANFAHRKGLIRTAPDVPKLTELRRAATSWTVEQVSAILTACRQRRGMIGEVRAADFWPALVLVAFDTGARIGALLRTPLDCLDLSAGVLTVPAEVQKQRQDQRFVLHPDTLAELARIVGKRVLLFPWHRSKAALWDHYRRILKAAGLPHGRRDHFHRLRRTSATLAELSAGSGAATLHLGHSDKAVTALYLDTTVLPARRIAELLPRPFVPAGAVVDGTIAKSSTPKPDAYSAAKTRKSSRAARGRFGN